VKKNILKEQWNDLVNAELGRQKLTRTQLAQRTGLSHPTIKAVLDKEPGVSLERILDVAQALSVSVMREGI
jgi:transcriptional regulator with XRE-family HTH domain